MVWNGMKWNEMEWNGMKWNEMVKASHQKEQGGGNIICNWYYA